METFVERMQIEYNELTERLTKLRVFVKSDKFAQLSAFQRDLLQQQENAMETYARVLSQRIILNGGEISNARNYEQY